MEERIEDQPYDDRHNTPPKKPFAPAPYTPNFADIERGAPVLWSGVGLCYRWSPGQELTDIGRSFGNPDALEDMHEVDLRTILAHLDSAARGITRELEARGLTGRR